MSTPTDEERARLAALDTLADATRGDADDPDAALAPALVILWSADEPERIGEVARVERASTLGRGPGEPDEPRLRWVQQRPGRSRTGPALIERRISRRQLELEPVADGLRVRNVGRTDLLVDGRVAKQATVSVGAVLRMKTLVLLVTARPRLLPRGRCELERPAWGQPDGHGQVGESPAAWALRDRVAFVGGRRGHVLVHGDSGTGKELVARALHACSERAESSLVSRNAATVPESLVDAELFGNVDGYPNPGMRARPGLVGEADGSSLFLDEIAEVPEAMHAHLLRVMDRGGEYHRLGEARVRRADLRLIGATNRPTDALKHDLLARFALQVEVPGLPERREDIPLLAVHLLRRAAADDPVLAEHFFDERGWPRLEPELVDALVRHPYTHHVRELERLLWRAIDASRGSSLERPEVLDVAPTPVEVDPADLSPEQIDAALTAHDGVLQDTWQALGLRNRFQLIRLLKKHGLGRYG